VHVRGAARVVSAGGGSSRPRAHRAAVFGQVRSEVIVRAPACTTVHCAVVLLLGKTSPQASAMTYTSNPDRAAESGGTADAYHWSTGPAKAIRPLPISLTRFAMRCSSQYSSACDR